MDSLLICTEVGTAPCEGTQSAGTALPLPCQPCPCHGTSWEFLLTPHHPWQHTQGWHSPWQRLRHHYSQRSVTVTIAAPTHPPVTVPSRAERPGKVRSCNPGIVEL